LVCGIEKDYTINLLDISSARLFQRRYRSKHKRICQNIRHYRKKNIAVKNIFNEAKNINDYVFLGERNAKEGKGDKNGRCSFPKIIQKDGEGQ